MYISEISTNSRPRRRRFHSPYQETETFIRSSLEELGQPQTQRTRCRTELAESLIIERLRNIGTEDVMRLYVDSFLADDAGGRPFPTQYSREEPGWERRTFPRCWLRRNRQVLEGELITRFRRASHARDFVKLHWYLLFIDHPSLHASEQARQSLHRLFEGTLGQTILQQARRDWGSEAIERLRLGFQRYADAEGQAERFALGEGQLSEQVLRYATSLMYYAQVICNLANGGTGDLLTRANVPGVIEAARGAWHRDLEETHRKAILAPTRGRVSPRRGEIRRVLVNEMERQLHRFARKIGWRYYQGMRDLTNEKIRQMAEEIGIC